MIRRLRAADMSATYAVFFDAIRNGTAPHYTAEQAKAWAPSEKMGTWWPDRIETGVTWVAEDDSTLTGMLTYLDGELDLFFVRPAWQGKGISSALYTRMLDHASAERPRHLTTFASLCARPFLQRRGWEVIEEETAIRNGVSLTRFRMALTLPARAPIR